MNKTFFLKNLAIFLIPLLIPLLILGSLSIILTQHYIKQEINKNNTNLLKQTQQNIELIFNEINSLSANLSTSPAIVIKLKKVLSNPNPGITIEDYEMLNSIVDLISIPAHSNHYIHSIYIYYNNDQGQFITSTNTVSNLNSYFDTSWYNSLLTHDNTGPMWTEIREIKQYSFEEKPTRILSLYRKLHSSGRKGYDGVVVLNIYIDYIEKLLSTLETLPSQSIYVLDENSNIVFRNKNSLNGKNIDMADILGTEDIARSYITTILSPNDNGWKYISIVPKNVLYQIPSKLSMLTFILGLISFSLGLLFTYYLTKRNYMYIQNILSIIESAKAGKPLPSNPFTVSDVYGYIIHNILKTFIDHNYLEVQLSERKYKIQALELMALQSQINPHFLYNTLDTINWKTIALTGKPNDITEMVQSLSDILKYSLGSSRRMVTLSEEIDTTKSYINIQQKRYEDKFDVIWEYDDKNDKLMQQKVIKLMLQPLLENSIYHGIKEKYGKGFIKIRIDALPSSLVIGIIDNGLGINPYDLRSIRSKLNTEEDCSDHIGLFNTSKRLKLTFGEQCMVKIRSKAGFGTAVYINIPLEENRHACSPQ